MAENASLRLQKFLADAGICSRRAAEELIAAGDVWVNGTVAVLGQKVDPDSDKIVVRGKQVRSAPQPRITLAVHKPRGLVCSNDDPNNPDTVFDLLPRELSKFRFFCAGRLDKDSEGLVILTTDGDLANRLMHPRNTIVKRYQVKLEEPFPAKRLPTLKRGVMLDGERHQVEYAALVNPDRDGTAVNLDVWMHHGKKREIRFLFMALGYEVRRLRRYQIGAFPLRGIPLRAGKKLSNKEIESLFTLPHLSPETPSSRSGRKPAFRNPDSHEA
ncbi:MAG: rRNA pseudouridine synthase [Opitutaceae bacterium]|nr:rRNA pseudouridine synthase [Opitutaceae bacterium]